MDHTEFYTELMDNMQKIDYFKVISLFKTFQGRSVEINIIGAVPLPGKWICNFDYADYDDEIAFGEFEEDQGLWFFLKKDGDLYDVWEGYDDFASEDNIIFKLKKDIFVTWIHVKCNFEGIEMAV